MRRTPLNSNFTIHGCMLIYIHVCMFKIHWYLIVIKMDWFAMQMGVVKFSASWVVLITGTTVTTTDTVALLLMIQFLINALYSVNSANYIFIMLHYWAFTFLLLGNDFNCIVQDKDLKIYMEECGHLLNTSNAMVRIAATIFHCSLLSFIIVWLGLRRCTYTASCYFCKVLLWFVVVIMYI